MTSAYDKKTYYDQIYKCKISVGAFLLTVQNEFDNFFKFQVWFLSKKLKMAEKYNVECGYYFLQKNLLSKLFCLNNFCFLKINIKNRFWKS
jgi:hypothetical protein